MDDLDPDALADELLACAIPQPAWTHAAHVAAGYGLVRRLGPDAALAALRTAIPLLNESHGVPNSDDDGYHDTITVFYVAALADALAREAPLAGLAEELGSAAPLAFWSRERLFSVEARHGWVAPDAAPLPFVVPASA